MKRTLKVILTLAVIFPALSTLSFAVSKMIHGNDDRVELFNASPETAELADSVVSLWDAAKMQLDPAAGTFALKTEKFGENPIKLCPTERFYGQPKGAFCSGALVGDDLVMTAGHCVLDQVSCDAIRIVFGFAIKKSGGSAPAAIRQEDVYACKKIITRFVSGEPASVGHPINPAGQGNGSDYALIQLDRKVAGHKPLAINRGQSLKKGDSIMIIGYPHGLPLKVAGDASIRDTSLEGYFTSNLDGFSGNSGSPVFNTATRLIEGIHVRGCLFSYWPTTAGCSTVLTAPQDGPPDEDETKVSALESLIPRLATENDSKGMSFRNVNAVIGAPAAQDDLRRRFNVDFQ